MRVAWRAVWRVEWGRMGWNGEEWGGMGKEWMRPFRDFLPLLPNPDGISPLIGD